MHGLRDPVLPPGLSARQPDPGLERLRLPGSLAGRARAAARDQQLPGVHGTAVSRALRGRVRPRHQCRPCHDQGGRGLDHRPRVRAGLDRGAAAAHADVEEGGGGRLRAGRPRRGGPAQSRGTLGDRVREVRPHRRAAPVRDPRVQDGEARARAASGAHGGGRGHLQAWPQHRRGCAGETAHLRLRRGAARGRRRGTARSPRCRDAS